MIVTSYQDEESALVRSLLEKDIANTQAILDMPESTRLTKWGEALAGPEVMERLEARQRVAHSALAHTVQNAPLTPEQQAQGVQSPLREPW